MKKNSAEKIFQSELNILKSGTKLLRENQFKDTMLVEKYKELLHEYEKLLKVTKKIFKISDYQGSFLKNREDALKNLLDNSNQGFLTVNYKLQVDPEYSAKCLQLFGDKIENKPIGELLFAKNDDEKERVARILDMLFTCTDESVTEKLLQQLPGRVAINDKQVDVEYKFFNKGTGSEPALMMILSDVTEQLLSQARIEYLSYYDSLSTVYNRSYINQILPNIITDFNLPLSIIICDMNGLKLANDVFGHQEGDQLIINAATALKQSCRKSDIICRWGGDEFLLILPKTNRQECHTIHQRILKACAEVEADPIAVSLSIGTATMERDNVQFSELFKEAEAKMYKEKLLLSKVVSKNIIEKINENLEKRGIETAEHAQRLKYLVVNFAKALGISSNSTDMDNLVLLASLHDIGKVLIPEEIYFKIGSLTDEEWEIIKAHSETGYKMAHSIGEPVIAEAILNLHEWWDGSGYPNGFQGEKIPYYSRIFSIVDAFDVMTHDTVYKKAKTKKEAVSELRSKMGIQFDPMLTEKFIAQLTARTH